jgi:hypothetical protein
MKIKKIPAKNTVSTMWGITFVLLFTTNCSISPVAPDPGYVEQPVVGGITSKNPNTNFYNQLSSAGIRLNQSEKNIVRQYQETKSTGTWASAEGTDSKSSLSSNFQTLKNSFFPNGPATEYDYLNMALLFAGSTNLYARYYFDTSYYKTRGKILVIKWDPQTKEFILIHTDGKISNYQMAGNIAAPRYIVIPENLSDV